MMLGFATEKISYSTESTDILCTLHTAHGAVCSTGTYIPLSLSLSPSLSLTVSPCLSLPLSLFLHKHYYTRRKKGRQP